MRTLASSEDCGSARGARAFAREAKGGENESGENQAEGCAACGIALEVAEWGTVFTLVSARGIKDQPSKAQT